MENNEINPEINTPVTPQIVEKKKSKNKIIFFGIIIIVIALIGVYYILRQQVISSLPKNNSDKSIVEIIATPTPVPFYEMTIPSLRARSYDSQLSELKKVSTNANYTSYLTSYTSDGFKINSQLTIPTGDRPIGGYPAIIFIHGYIPPTLYETLTNYSSYVDYLARNGFVILKVDLRGHADSEGEASGAYYSSDYIVDVLNAYSALQKNSDINPEAIGIWGHSMAGNVSMRALAAKPDIPAVVIWAGAVYTYSDMQEFGIDDNSYRPPVDNTERQRKRDQLFATHGQFDPKSSFWATVAATNYLKDIKGAIHLDHAVDDAVVNIGYSRGLTKLLDEAGVENELIEYQSGGHNISGANFNIAMQNTVEFFKKYLK